VATRKTAWRFRIGYVAMRTLRILNASKARSSEGQTLN
jgi:hypothetical protein